MKRKYIIAVATILLLSSPLLYFNIRNNEIFFIISVGSLLTLYITIFVSYFLVQKMTNGRKQKEIYIKLLSDMQKLVTDKSAYTISPTDDSARLTTIKRSMSNYIGLIDKYSKKFHLEDEIIYIKDKFSEYETLLSDHISDFTYLSKSSKELKRPLELITEKLYEMMLKIFD